MSTVPSGRRTPVAGPRSATTEEKPDPVLLRLQDWATEAGLNRDRVARQLQISRTAVAGWFLALEAAQAGTQPPNSARRFRYVNQKPEVQRRIADVLNTSVAALRAESLAGHQPPSSQPGDPASPVASVSPVMLDLAESLLGDLALGRTDRSVGSLRHRVAEAVERVEDVVGTLVVGEPRGHESTEPYQHQVVVFVGKDTPGHVDQRWCRERINQELVRAALPAYWEHGAREPSEELRYVESIRLGSLVCPYVAASHGSAVGLLVPPLGPAPTQLRFAAIVTNPYGGSGPIAGHVARALGCGHVRAEDLVQGVRDAQVRRHGGNDDRGAFLSDAAERDAAYVIHHGLYALQRSALPGAWLLSMEVKPAANYRPLQDALVELNGVLVTVHLGEQWLRMAAWRLAAATLNTEAQRRNSREPASSDQLDLAQGQKLSAREIAVLRRQSEQAHRWLATLQDWETVIADLSRRRAERPGQHTLRVTLDPLPDFDCFRFGDEPIRVVTGQDRFTGNVAFPDDVHSFMDGWIVAATDAIEGLATVAGYGPADLGRLTEQVTDGAVAAQLRARHAATAPT